MICIKEKCQYYLKGYCGLRVMFGDGTCHISDDIAYYKAFTEREKAAEKVIQENQ